MKELFEKIENIERKMEDIEKDIKELKNKIHLIDNWQYAEGNMESALLNNIKRPEKETIGKIYYIQAYFDGTVTQHVPYMVIGINHDDTENTVDLMSLVAADYIPWNVNYSSWEYGKYSTSGLYSWLANTCPIGYSSNIQSKMVNMTERWREATGNATGTMMSRTTKCKLLNPVELFGHSVTSYSEDWEYASSSDHKTDFDSKYGTLYPIWTDSISALSNRRVFSNLVMTSATYYWTNSWLAFASSGNNARCFFVNADGSCNYDCVIYTNSVAPVIRLADKSEDKL